MTSNRVINDALDSLKRNVERLSVYEPAAESWQKAVTETYTVRKQIATLLGTREGVEIMRSSDALNDIKHLIPENARDVLKDLKVADFVFGLIFRQPYTTFERVYHGYNAEYGKELSLEARKSTNNIIKSSFIYGEIVFFSFADAILSIAPTLPEHSIFYDLGAGTGKAVITAALVHPFDQAYGIELLQPLVAFAEKRTNYLNKQNLNQFGTDIEFLEGDFLKHPWTDGDVVFCHCTMFDAKEWGEISLQAEKMKQGAYFLSISHILKSGLFEVIGSKNVSMSWGTATLYIHRRRKIGRWAAQMLRGGTASRTDLLHKASNSSDDLKVNRQRD